MSVEQLCSKFDTSRLLIAISAMAILPANQRHFNMLMDLMEIVVSQKALTSNKEAKIPAPKDLWSIIRRFCKEHPESFSERNRDVFVPPDLDPVPVFYDYERYEILPGTVERAAEFWNHLSEKWRLFKARDPSLLATLVEALIRFVLSVSTKMMSRYRNLQLPGTTRMPKDDVELPSQRFLEEWEECIRFSRSELLSICREVGLPFNICLQIIVSQLGKISCVFERPHPNEVGVCNIAFLEINKQYFLLLPQALLLFISGTVTRLARESASINPEAWRQIAKEQAHDLLSELYEPLVLREVSINRNGNSVGPVDLIVHFQPDIVFLVHVLHGPCDGSRTWLFEQLRLALENSENQIKMLNNNGLRFKEACQSGRESPKLDGRQIQVYTILIWDDLVSDYEIMTGGLPPQTWIVRFMDFKAIIRDLDDPLAFYFYVDERVKRGRNTVLPSQATVQLVTERKLNQSEQMLYAAWSETDLYAYYRQNGDSLWVNPGGKGVFICDPYLWPKKSHELSRRSTPTLLDSGCFDARFHTKEILPRVLLARNRRFIHAAYLVFAWGHPIWFCFSSKSQPTLEDGLISNIALIPPNYLANSIEDVLSKIGITVDHLKRNLHFFFDNTRPEYDLTRLMPAETTRMHDRPLIDYKLVGIGFQGTEKKSRWNDLGISIQMDLPRIVLGLMQSTNDTERLILAVVLISLNCLTSKRISRKQFKRLMDFIVPPGPAKFHVKRLQDIAPAISRSPPVPMYQSKSTEVKTMIADYLSVHNYAERRYDSEHTKEICNELFAFLQSKLEAALAEFEMGSLITWTLVQVEDFLAQEWDESIRLAIRRQLRIETQADDDATKLMSRHDVRIALRHLLETALYTNAKGSRLPSLPAYCELIATSLELVRLSNSSELAHTGLQDIESLIDERHRLWLVPGAATVDNQELTKERTESVVSFAQGYIERVTSPEDAPPEIPEVMNNLEQAMLKDLGCGISHIAVILHSLIRVEQPEIQRNSTVISLPKARFVATIRDRTGLSKSTIQRVVELFSLDRFMLEKEPPEPWRFHSRLRRMTMRPILRYRIGNAIVHAYSKSFLHTAISDFLWLLFEGRSPPQFRERSYPQIDKALDSLRMQQSKDFEKRVIAEVKTHVPVSFPNVKDLSDMVPSLRGRLPGEVEVIGFDVRTRSLLMIEAKDVRAAYTPADARGEIQDFWEPKNGYVTRFLKKADFIKAHLDELLEGLRLSTRPHWEVRGAFVTAQLNISRFFRGSQKNVQFLSLQELGQILTNDITRISLLKLRKPRKWLNRVLAAIKKSSKAFSSWNSKRQ